MTTFWTELHLFSSMYYHTILCLNERERDKGFFKRKHILSLKFRMYYSKSFGNFCKRNYAFRSAFVKVFLGAAKMLGKHRGLFSDDVLGCDWNRL